mgnify:CR=1 FL=1
MKALLEESVKEQIKELEEIKSIFAEDKEEVKEEVKETPTPSLTSDGCLPQTMTQKCHTSRIT